MFRSKAQISSHLLAHGPPLSHLSCLAATQHSANTFTNTSRSYGIDKGAKWDRISMSRLRVLSLQEIMKGKSYGRKDRNLKQEQRIATDRKVKINVKYPISNYGSYGKYSQMLNKVSGMTDDLVAEMERIHRGANQMALSGEHLNEHSNEFPSKDETQMEWYRTQQKELDEYWFTRWTFGITPYQRMQLRIQDRVANLNLLKRKNLPRSQPAFVDGVSMQQFHSPKRDAYLRFMRDRQIAQEDKKSFNQKYKNEDFTPLPNLKHENVEDDSDELLGLVDITKMDLSRIDIAKEEIKRMYYWENKISKKQLNRVRQRLRRETNMIKQINREGPREYMLKRGLVDLEQDPNFAEDVINYERAKKEKKELENTKEEEIELTEEEKKINWLLEVAKSDESIKRAFANRKMRYRSKSQYRRQEDKKSVELLNSKNATRDHTRKLLHKRIEAAFKKIQTPNVELHTRGELKDIVDMLIREGLRFQTEKQADEWLLNFYDSATRPHIEKVDGVVPFPLKRLENVTPVASTKEQIKILKKALSKNKWEEKLNTPAWILRAQQQSRLKRLREIYETNTQAAKERKEFNEKIWVEDTSKVPDMYTPQDFGLLYQIPLKDYKKVLGPAIHTSPVGKQIKKSTSRSLCLMVREQIMDIVPESDRVLYNQYTDTGDRTNRGFIFTGEAGTGKTCMLLQAIHHCYRKGFLIFHIPNGRHWAKGPHYIEPSSILPGYFDAPEPTLDFLKTFFKANTHVLGRIRLTQHYGLGDPSIRLSTLYDLVHYAIDRGLDEVGVHFKLILDELSLNKTVPMLFAIDEYNHFSEMSGFKYGNLLRFTEVVPQKVHTNRFVLHRALNRMLLDNDRNKMFVCAQSNTQPSKKNQKFEDMILTPIDVPRYNEKEMRTMVNYYCANHFINRPTEEYVHSVRFMSGGIGSELFKEVSRESF